MKVWQKSRIRRNFEIMKFKLTHDKKWNNLIVQNLTIGL